jgi:hypothetical protein
VSALASFLADKAGKVSFPAVSLSMNRREQYKTLSRTRQSFVSIGSGLPREILKSWKLPCASRDGDALLIPL